MAESRDIFWHVAAMNHWREVFMEQLRLINNAGFSGKLHIGFAGRADWIGFMKRGLEMVPFEWSVTHHGDNIRRYEYPTLRMVWDRCRDCCGEVAYIHTKGVSKPGCWVSTMWRWAMNAAIIGNIEDHSLLPAGCGVAGAFLRPRYPEHMWHFQGNFWIAKASHIAALKEPHAFAAQETNTPRQGWRCPRFPAEYWIGSEHRIDEALELHPVPGMVWPQNHTQWSESVERQRIVTATNL